MKKEKEEKMKATLTTNEFNEFCAKVDTLDSKGYTLPIYS